MDEIIHSILRTIFPEKCLSCDQDVLTKGVCAECWCKIHWFSGSICSRCCSSVPVGINLCIPCQSTKSKIIKIFSPMGYDDTTRRIILQFKNMSNIRFASWIADMIVSRFAGVYFDCVVPVPLHFFKRIWRGYNQSHLLAKMISNRIKCPDLNALTRTRFTKSQGSLNFNNRQKNVVRAFDVNKGYDLKNKTVLLVDDVYTTGATLEECANIIHRAGAKQIYACVGAKTWRV